MTAPVLTTERLTLGPLLPEHTDPVAAFYSSERTDFVGGRKTPEMAWRHFATEIGHWTLRGYGNFAVTETATGQLVGLVGPWFPYGWPEPEIGWMLLDGFEGRGFATEAAERARAWAYDTLGWTTAISLISPGNGPSAAVAQRLGAWLEKETEHERFGPMQIWRHPGPNALRAGDGQ
ncbi:MAG: GNAT family N-acetyltransferase [Pseudomonadota bacterium]